MKKRKTRGIGIRAKIILPTSIVVTLLCIVMGMNSYLRTKEGLIAMGVEEAQMAAAVSAKIIDADTLEKMSADKKGSTEYNALLESMLDAKKECGIQYLYTLYTDGEYVYYGIDADETDSAKEYGTIFETSYQELKSVFDGEQYVQDYIDSTEDGELITAYTPLADSSGNITAIIGCDYDASGVAERLNKSLQRVVQLSLFCLLIALTVLNFMVGTVIRRLRKVDGKIYELVHSNGDLTQTLDVHTGDEMEMIAGNVNELLQHIRKIMLNISDNSTQLQESSRTVSDKLADAGDGITDVSSVMEEMSAAMEESGASLEQVNDSIRQIFASIETIYEQAKGGSASSNEIMESASAVYHRAVKEKQDAMLQAAEMAASVQQKIEKSKDVEKIRVLSTDIINITDETNLLAINASIEAAQAGDAGRGFMVVANEIGKLAASSAASATKIQIVTAEIIQTVDELAAEAEDLITFMNETAMGGYEKLLETSDSYQTNVGNMNEMMQGFAAKSEQLRTNMNEIKIALEEVQTAVNESTQGVMNVTDTAVELTNNVSDIQKEADSNLDIVDRLNNEVGKFKL